MEESEDPIAGGKRAFINKKQKPPRMGKTNWLASRQGRAGQGRAGQGRAGQGRAGQGRAGQGRAGQGRAGQGRAGQGRAGHLTLGNEPTRNCKHKEIIKGANDEGNEGKQLGKLNQ